MTSAGAATGIPAADLLATTECTATCLLAREPDGCECRCGGTWHGTLSGMVVSPNTPGGGRPREASGSRPRSAREPRLSYGDAVRDFTHAQLATLPAYARLRQALSDLGNELPDAGGMSLAEWLAAVRDMAATAPYGDMCMRCTDACRGDGHNHDPDEFPRPCGAYRLWWPNAAVRRGNYMRGRYECDQSHVWGCSWLVSMTALR